MMPLKRRPVSKGRSARTFRKKAQRTKGANMTPPPMRGGYRF